MDYIFVKDELYHHGILGQKWGVRRYQNPDGSLTAVGKKRYFGVGNSRFRPKDRSQRSKNWQINRMGGRKINADYETRRARGEKLVKAGRSDLGAVGRHIGRDIVYGTLSGVAVGALGYVAASGEHHGMYGITAGANAATAVLKGAAGLYAVSNLIKTYQDISDMHTYKDSKSRSK